VLPLMDDQQMLEAFLPHTPHEPFTDGIGSRRMIGVPTFLPPKIPTKLG